MSQNGEPQDSITLVRLLAPLLTVFVSNAAIMVLELVAGRVISSYLGMSLYTWTAIIGLILAGMSVGNYVGGWLADRVNAARALGPTFLLSAIAAYTVLPLNNFVGELSVLSGFSWPARIFVHVGLVFIGPSMLLGIITPLVAKMALELGRGTGRTIGTVFASGAAGSILGTFFAGYYLVLAFGVHEIVTMMSAVLGVLGLLYLFAFRGASASKRSGVSDRTLSWRPFLDQLGPNATVFVSNAGFMILEMVASRVVARQFGASLYTWTTVIGIVLAGVTLGNFASGRLADRWPSRKFLAFIFVVSSVCVLGSTGLSMFMLRYWESSYILLVQIWPVQIALFVTAAYFIPCLVLGAVSPMVVKLTLVEGRSEGRTVGAIYAWGTIGSIVGTFSAGYFLIDWLGAIPLSGLVALLLAVTGLVYLPRNAIAMSSVGAAALICILLFMNPFQESDIVYEDESNYSYIKIVAQADAPNLRAMTLDKLVHSAVNLEDPSQFFYGYEKIYEAVMDKFYPGRPSVHAMVIGGGGYVFPHYLEVAWPGSVIEVSEIDPAVTEAAHVAFGFPRDTSVDIYNMDARNRVADLVALRRRDASMPKFDFIFGDSINDFSVPYHLTTVEFVQMLHSLLLDEGMYLLNMIDTFSEGRFLAGEISTLRQVFSHVYIFNTIGNPTNRDTYVIVCSNRPRDLADIASTIRERYEFTGRLLREEEVSRLLERTGSTVLTDNYAPIENFLAPVARKRYGEAWEVREVLAKRLADKGKSAAAIRHVRLGLEVQPNWPDMERLLAELLFAEGHNDEAISTLRALIPREDDSLIARISLARKLTELNRFDEANVELHRVVASDAKNVDAHFMLGVDAMRRQDAAEAIEHWKAVLAVRPEHLDALYNLGLAYVSAGQIDEAIGQWRHALEQNPKHGPSSYNLVLAQTMIGRYDEAWESVSEFRERGMVLDPQLIERLEQASGRSE